MTTIAAPEHVHGYHFRVRCIPKWHAVAPLVVQRARAVGLTVSDDGRELEPRATSLAFVGTRWTRFSHGGLRFDVLEERRSLQGDVVSSAGNSGEHPTYALGLATPGALKGHPPNEFGLEMAVGLWLRDGALTLRPWEESSLGEEVIADFHMWTSLEALSRVALGEPAMGRPSSGNPVVAKHTSPVWAPGFEPTIAHRQAEVRARFSSPRMSVTVEIDLIVESVGR